MFVACSCTGFAGCFTCGAMRMLFSMWCTRRCTCPADMRTERTEVTVMLRAASQRIHGCTANIGAVEIDQCTIGFATFANVSRSTRLGCMDRFFTCLDTSLQVVFVRCGSLHIVLRSGVKKRISLTRPHGRPTLDNYARNCKLPHRLQAIKTVYSFLAAQAIVVGLPSIVFTKAIGCCCNLHRCECLSSAFQALELQHLAGAVCRLKPVRDPTGCERI